MDDGKDYLPVKGLGDREEQYIAPPEKRIEDVRLDALIELHTALDKFAPEFTDEQLKEMDIAAKQKRPLDRALGNLQFLNDVWKACPSAHEYTTRTTHSHIDVYTPKNAVHGARIQLETGWQNRPSKPFVSSGGGDSEMTPRKMSELYSLPEGSYGHNLIIAFSNMSVAQMVEKIHQALKYDPKKDEPAMRQKEIERTSGKAKVVDTIIHDGDTLNVIEAPDTYESPRRLKK